MLCPFCHHPENQVIDTRPSLYNQIPGIRRRRVCLQCKKRFSSFEMTINDLEGVEPATLDGLLQQITKLFKDAPRTNYKAFLGPLVAPEILKSEVNDKTPIIPLKTPPVVNGDSIKEAMRRARQKYIEEMEELEDDDLD